MRPPRCCSGSKDLDPLSQAGKTIARSSKPCRSLPHKAQGLPRSSTRTKWQLHAQSDPPDVPKEEKQPRGRAEWFQNIVSRFGPISSKPQLTTVLDFEKPLVELDNRIKEVRRVAEENGVDVSSQIQELETRAKQLRKDTYSRLTPVQRLQVARHPNRPTCLDIVLNISDKFVELHGDRAGLDDPAIVCGIASIDGISFMIIGHQKGRNTKENIHRNFGMPQPNGYRKALRFMRQADHFGFPILTFVDTPGAFAGKYAEEEGQGEAIAVNLREMFGLGVPIISTVIGEGGSGGALAIGCANYSFILENSVYYVASPEACAAILWKSRENTPMATAALKITAQELVEFGVMDGIIPEPLGGAHAEPVESFPAIKKAIMDIYHSKYAKMDEIEIKKDRYAKFRKIGQYEEFLVSGGQYEEARRVRAEAEGAYTQAGTWAPNQEEADLIEEMVDRDEDWDALMTEKEEWLHPPVQPYVELSDWVIEEDDQQAGSSAIGEGDQEPKELLILGGEQQPSVATENGHTQLESNGSSAEAAAEVPHETSLTEDSSTTVDRLFPEER